MRLYRNLTEIMKAKKLGRKQAQKQVGSTIFELDRPIGELKCYICVDELYNRLGAISKTIFKKYEKKDE